MIVSFTQTSASLEPSWTFKTGEIDLAVAYAPYDMVKTEIFLQNTSDINLRMYFNPLDKSFGSKWENRLSYHIFENDIYSGHIVQRIKGRFFKAYNYIEMIYGGTTYHAYEVLQGKQGTFLCIYHGETLIAMVEKDYKVVDYLDIYTLYFKDPAYFKVIALLSLYYDMTHHGGVKRHGHSMVSRNLAKTYKKELLSKYHPAFIEEVKSQDTYHPF